MTKSIMVPALLAGVSIFHPAAIQPALAQQSAAAVYEFDEPAQDLSEALIRFSRITGMPLATDPDVMTRLRSRAVRGAMTAPQALATMTRSLPVTARIEGGTVIVQARARQVAARPAAVTGPAAPGAAPAMTAPAKKPFADEIIVTGFRESLTIAQARKKAATGSQEVILAEDIAAFPDQNLAEALQRVPGVSISRDSGEGRRISLRGLGPSFTRTQLNGMEVLSNTASGLDSRSGASRSRNFDYSVFASELFNEVVVEKSYSAEQEEGGIGGTIALRTAKPFDYDGKTFAVSAKGQLNEYTETLTPRVVGLASLRSGNVGMLVSAAFSRADTLEWGYRNWNWSRINLGADNVGPGIDAATRDRLVNAQGDDRVWMSRAQTYGSWANRRDRLGLTGTFQYNDEEGTDLTLDVLYGKLSNDREEHVLGNAGSNGLSSNDITGTQVLTDVTINEYGSINGAAFDHVDLRNEGKNTDDQTVFWQVAFNGHTELTDRLTLDARGGWSRSVFDSAWQRVYMLSNDHSVSFSGMNENHPVNGYDFDPADPQAWTFQRIQWREDRIESEFRNAAASLSYELSPVSTFKAGGAFKRFESNGYRYHANGSHPNGLANAPTRLNPHRSDIDFIVPDVVATFAALGEDAYLDAENLQAGTDFAVTENSFAAFGQYALDTDIAGMGLRANLGVRYYRTKLNSKGNSVTDNGLVPVEIETSYDGFLPALNLALDLTPQIVARFSANRNISRPGLTDLSAAATVRVAGFGGTISAGNPSLSPYRADSIEGSLEYYDGTRGFLALGVFYKDMKSFVTSETAQVPYSETGYPLSLLEDGQDGSIIFNFTRPVNGPGASIHGVEFAARRDFDFLPGALANIGALVNGTYASGSSDVYYSDVPYDLPLGNLSKWSVNSTVYYDTERFGARASMAYRSRYRSGSGGNGNIGEFRDPSMVFDASAYYNVTEALQIRVSALNLTDERIIQYADTDAKRMMTSTVSGRVFSFGASMRF